MSRIIRNLWNLGENVTKSELCKVLDGIIFLSKVKKYFKNFFCKIIEPTKQYLLEKAKLEQELIDLETIQGFCL